MIDTPLPAIIIGGPPHSGKSVLSYSLTKALAAQRMDHYLLRACPDGEGNWSQEIAAPVVERIRRKGEFSEHFLHELCQDLAARHLPLLVDVGGKITPEQEAILAHGTAALLLVREDKAQEAVAWRAAFARHRLPLLADLTSALHGESRVVETAPTVRGRFVGLERGTMAGGALFDLLCTRLADTLTVPEGLLRHRHRQLAPHTAWIEVDRIDAHAAPVQQRPDWVPEELSLLLRALAPAVARAVYGRGPGWLYAALAHHTYPATLHLFDARMAWVPVPVLPLAPTPQGQPVAWTMLPHVDHQRLEIHIHGDYLAYEALAELTPPHLAGAQGVVLSGKVPHWLLCATALAYRSRPWVAIYQPQLKDRAVVVYSRTPTHPVGTTIAAPAPPKA